MKALVLGAFGDLGVEERPDPTPGPGDLVVSVTATGICGSDIHGFTGDNGRRHPGQIMGHETVGRVHILGREVTSPAPGTVVTINPVLACGSCPACVAGRPQACAQPVVLGVKPDVPAAFAELVAVPARNVIPLPERMPAEHGALVEPLSVGYHAARRAGTIAGQCVLVVGGGPIGQACVLAALRLEAAVVAASEIDPGRRQLLAKLGAIPLSPGEDMPLDVAKALGGPATVVLDAVGSSNSLADAVKCSAPGGRIVLVGMAEPAITLPAYGISTEEREIAGSFCYSAAEFLETAQWAATVPERLNLLIQGRVGLDGAARAFQELAEQRSSASKILVFPHGVPAPVEKTQP
jgi:threonine dehydrogenase-like Zn-dependent dehydrogenase